MKKPLWFIALTIITLLPMAMIPSLMAAMPTHATETPWPNLVRLYPLACLGYAICAWLCWPARKTLATILIIMSLATSAAMIAPLFTGFY